jgi:tricorn protease-like protein
MSEHEIGDFLEIKRSFCPSFSPDGSSVAFLSDLSGVAQIYLVPRRGGDIKQLTSYPEPISEVAFSPTNNELVFAMAQGGNERFQLYLLNLASREKQRLTNNDAAIYRFGGWSYDGKSITYTSNVRNGTDFDVFVMDIADNRPRLRVNFHVFECVPWHIKDFRFDVSHDVDGARQPADLTQLSVEASGFQSRNPDAANVRHIV